VRPAGRAARLSPLAAAEKGTPLSWPSPTFAERFQREAQAMARFSHPGNPSAEGQPVPAPKSWRLADATFSGESQPPIARRPRGSPRAPAGRSDAALTRESRAN